MREVIVSLVRHAAAAPSPLCGGGVPLREQGSGEGSAGSGKIATGDASCTVALPLSRLAPLSTLPRRGGREFLLLFSRNLR